MSFLNVFIRNLNKGVKNPYNSQLKDKEKKQKRGFPIKDFGNDGGGRFPIKDFENDGGRGHS